MATTIANLLIKLEADTQQVSKGFNQVKAAALGIGVALAATAKKGLDAFNIQDKAEKSLLTALKGREDIQKRLLQQASDFQQVSLFGDEEIIQQQAFLASLGLTEQQINDVTAAALDLASGTGTSLDSAVKNLAKTYSGLTGELGESIPQLRELTTEQLKAGEAVNVVSEAFRGQAQAAADAGTGGLTQLSNALGDVLEVVGEALAPAVNAAAQLLQDWAQQLTNASETGGFKKFQAGLVAGVEAIKVWVEGLRAAIGPIIAIKDGAEAVGKALKGDFTGAAEQARKAYSELTKPIEFFLDLGDNVRRVTDAYAGALEDLTSEVPAAVTGQEQYGKAVEDATKKVESATKATEELARARRDVVTSVQQVETTNLPETVGTRQTAGGGQIEESTGISERENELLRQKSELLTGLVTSYTELQGPLLDYVASLESIAEKQAAINSLTSFGNSILLEAADNLTAYARQGGSSLKEFANIALQSARKAVGAFIRKGVAGAVSKALTGPIPYPANIAAGAIAGALAQTLFNKLISSLKIPAFGDGGLVTGPTLALVGEKGPELITPLSQLGRGPLDVRVTGEIEGNKLKLLMDRYDQIGARKFT